MSYDSFKEGLTIATQCSCYEIIGNVDCGKIEEAEALLNIKFSKLHYKFYKEVGILSYLGSEYYGMSNRPLEGLPGSNVVLLALLEREETHLPSNWIPLYFLDGGYIAYFDYTNLNDDGEPRVISAFYNGKQYVNDGVLADDLGDFILMKAKEQM